MSQTCEEYDFGPCNFQPEYKGTSPSTFLLCGQDPGDAANGHLFESEPRETGDSNERDWEALRLPPSLPEATDFDVEPCMEEDLGMLLEAVGDSGHNQTPPLSVLEGIDRDSRDREEYDPALQHSSLTVLTVETPSEGGSPNNRWEAAVASATNCEVDLMDSDVDWDEVLVTVRCHPHEDSEHIPYRTPPVAQPRRSPPVRSPASRMEPGQHGLISEASNQPVVRTYFRIGELLAEGTHCFNSRQKTAFELYARVTYSSQECDALSSRAQRLHFADLFRAGSVLS